MTHSRRLLTSILLTVALPGCLNFHIVEAGQVYRSAQPDEVQLRSLLEKHQIKTVLFLRKSSPGDQAYEVSNTVAKASGADFIWLPLSAHRYPSQTQLLELWSIFETANYPILLHCRGGADRSGLASGIYMLQAHSDIDIAAAELALWPYRHTGMLGSFKLDQVFELYRPYLGKIPFPRWVRDHYYPRDHAFHSRAVQAAKVKN